MKDTLNPEERLALCRLLLNRTGEWSAPEQRNFAIDAVFEITMSGYIKVKWLESVEALCGLDKGELCYFTGLIKYRTKN